MICMIKARAILLSHRAVRLLCYAALYVTVETLYGLCDYGLCDYGLCVCTIVYVCRLRAEIYRLLRDLHVSFV